MDIYTLVSLICFLLLTAYLVYVVVNIALKPHKERTVFLRSFKKGKAAIIYVVCLPLILIGHLYAGQEFFPALFNAINKTVNTVVLKYELSSNAQLLADNRVYKITLYYAYVLIALNALLFTFSLISQRIWCFFRKLFFSLSGKDKLVIVGNNEDSITLFESAGGYARLLLDRIADKDAEQLYARKVSYLSVSSAEETVGKLLSMAGKKKGCRYYAVINTKDEERNIRLLRQFIARLDEKTEEERSAIFSSVQLFVYGDPRYEAIYEDAMSSGYGIIRYVNKYQQIAMDFIDRYPLSQFLTEKQLDTESSLIRPEADLNVFMIGFGKTNRQIFLTSVANNQFMTGGEGGPVLKKVHYFIYDKENAQNNKNLNHNYYRYFNEVADRPADEYLPLPDQPAEETYFKLDINDIGFYQSIRANMTANPNAMNFLIISFGRDLENIDFAQKMVEKRQEWGLENLIIFVKVRAYHKEQTLLEQDACCFIGNETDCVYHIERLLGDTIYRMAKARNQIYALEYEISGGSAEAKREGFAASVFAKAEDDWYRRKSQLERESSLYCCLSLRSKLQLMGLDYCPMDDPREALSEEEYLSLYAGSDRPVFDTGLGCAEGKKIIRYGLDFADSRRRTMAIQEHLRWNSFMISKGMVPATIRQILEEKTVTASGKEKFTNGKSYQLRRHGNLTTFDGLVTFRRMLAERDHCDEAQKDVIKYDYQILDDAYWLLSGFGLKIVRK